MRRHPIGRRDPRAPVASSPAVGAGGAGAASACGGPCPRRRVASKAWENRRKREMHESNDAHRWVLDGAYGFTAAGFRIEALALGLRPVVAGRSADKIGEMARTHGLEQCVASMDDADALTQMLRGARLVLNAAGPMGETAVPLMQSCLSAGARYVDIGGDVSVLRKQLELAGAFQQARIAAVLAVGFDVVPTDYAAKWVAFDEGKLVVGADEIRLGLSLPLSMSRGSARAFVDEVHQGTLVLRKRAPWAASPTSRAHFGVRLRQRAGRVAGEHLGRSQPRRLH